MDPAVLHASFNEYWPVPSAQAGYSIASKIDKLLLSGLLQCIKRRAAGVVMMDLTMAVRKGGELVPDARLEWGLYVVQLEGVTLDEPILCTAWGIMW